MKRKRYQDIFFLFGLTILIIMATQLDFAQVKSGLQRAGYWFIAVVALWGLLYMLNTSAWLIIIKNSRPNGKQHNERIGFWWLYKLTVSGFALNYATPGGLMGGEPYRIMMLAPKIGTASASSSVILYVMTHIFSHFWFWLLAAVLYVATQPTGAAMALLLAIIAAVCVMAIAFFIRGYKRGFTVGCVHLLSRFPMVKRWAGPFFERNREKLQNIDRQIASLHNQNPKAFAAAVALELLCRILSALEIFFTLLVIMPSANYLQCILILAFTSLFANMLFFLPLQLGGREGGFLMSARGLSLPANAAIFVALIVRVRELIWTAIGLLLIKIDTKQQLLPTDKID